ncbi:hypothetical protein Q5752_001535 [Cryptotrichosporon argae]
MDRFTASLYPSPLPSPSPSPAASPSRSLSPTPSPLATPESLTLDLLPPVPLSLSVSMAMSMDMSIVPASLAELLDGRARTADSYAPSPSLSPFPTSPSPGSPDFSLISCSPCRNAHGAPVPLRLARRADSASASATLWQHHLPPMPASEPAPPAPRRRPVPLPSAPGSPASFASRRAAASPRRSSLAYGPLPVPARPSRAFGLELDLNAGDGVGLGRARTPSPDSPTDKPHDLALDCGPRIRRCTDVPWDGDEDAAEPGSAFSPSACAAPSRSRSSLGALGITGTVRAAARSPYKARRTAADASPVPRIVAPAPRRSPLSSRRTYPAPRSSPSVHSLTTDPAALSTPLSLAPARTLALTPRGSANADPTANALGLSRLEFAPLPSPSPSPAALPAFDLIPLEAAREQQHPRSLPARARRPATLAGARPGPAPAGSPRQQRPATDVSAHRRVGSLPRLRQKPCGLGTLFGCASDLPQSPCRTGEGLLLHPTQPWSESARTEDDYSAPTVEAAALAAAVHAAPAVNSTASELELRPVSTNFAGMLLLDYSSSAVNAHDAPTGPVPSSASTSTPGSTMPSSWPVSTSTSSAVAIGASIWSASTSSTAAAGVLSVAEPPRAALAAENCALRALLDALRVRAPARQGA